MRLKADISIIGCGWLGLPLAEQLVQKGYIVKGSTTTPEKVQLLQHKEIIPYLINLQQINYNSQTLSEFLDTDILLINIPPKLRSGNGESYLNQLQVLLQAHRQSSVGKVIFISSTAVYPDLNRVVTEEDTDYTRELDPDNILLQAEQLFMDQEDWVTTVVRFAGLVGSSRHPGRFMAGKKHLPNGDTPVNLIHLDDCVSILIQIIEQDKWGEIYNACADKHPARQDFYYKATLALGLEPPAFDTMQHTQFKLISNQKLKDELAYTFLHPDPMEFF